MPPRMYAFEIALHARPPEAGDGPSLTDVRGTWRTLLPSRESLAAPLAIGFEGALERLAAIERLYAEPDGSFVWACSRSPGAATAWWQVDGMVHDRGGRVLLVDLTGSCPEPEFDRLLGAFGWPGQPLMMQLTRPAVFLDEPTFRRHAAARGLAGDGETLRPG